MMREAGESHNISEMLATQDFPGTRTDREFNQGRCNGNQFEKTPGLGDYYKARAEAAGVNTTGKTYLSGLASFPGDPTAWVSDRHDVLRVCREKGFKCSGAVDYTPPEAEPIPDVPIAEDIVEREVDAYMANDPGERRADVEERVTAMLTGSVDANPLLVE
jgi:hypothetical protein